jgi:cyclopropane fatty-acyl-phospholipid synthase-like methyltransferase
MNALSFTGEIARLQQAAAESHDNIARRSTVLSALNLRTGERVLEVGCGAFYPGRTRRRMIGSSARKKRRP